MIKIEFNEPDHEDWESWRETCRKVQEEHNQKIQEGNKSAVKGHIYGGQKTVYFDPEGPFHGKCVYCESKVFGNQDGDIEHFRPKSRIVDHNTNKPITIVSSGRTINHPGYYWLAYDCKNFLPSCLFCNRREKKGYFPVDGQHAINPGDEIHEQPLLINPCWDNPEEHIDMTMSGVFIPKTNQGDTCIKMFKLNDRDLPKERKKVYESIREKMSLLYLHAVKRENEIVEKYLREINMIKNGSETFTFAARKAINDSQSVGQQISTVI